MIRIRTISTFILTFGMWYTNSCGQTLAQEIATIPQNACAFLPLHQPHQITDQSQKKLVQNFLYHYYSPWTKPFLYIQPKQLLVEQKFSIRQCLQNPGWYERNVKHTRAWMMDIATNMNLKDYPNHPTRAITTQATALRVLPTVTPSFGNPKKAGQGFPFDNLQVSHLNNNAPIYVMHTSRDKAWNLVLTADNAWGWVQSKDIAFANAAFVEKWQQSTTRFITPIRDNQAIVSRLGYAYFQGRIGQILPLLKSTARSNEILIAVKNDQGQAVTRTAFIKRSTTQPWPLLANSSNVAHIANNFIGQPYGWGGVFSYRDCSATLKDLFAPFAIWLPRNSHSQAHEGLFTSLAKLTPKQKKQKITQNAIPHFTLLWYPGHIMLYIGHHNNDIYAFHTSWGLHTRSLVFNTEGRDVIGRTVITPLQLSKNHFDIPKDWLDLVQGYTFVVPPSQIEQQS